MSLVMANIKADDKLKPSIQSTTGQRSHAFRAGVRTLPRALMLAGVECRGSEAALLARRSTDWKGCVLLAQTDATDLHATLEVVVPNM